MRKNPCLSDAEAVGYYGTEAEALHIFDTPLLLARNSGLSFDQRFCKRLLDLLVSTILLVITSPIMLIAALCIKLYDHGPGVL